MVERVHASAVVVGINVGDHMVVVRSAMMVTMIGCGGGGVHRRDACHGRAVEHE
jgi:hypothetical protein